MSAPDWLLTDDPPERLNGTGRAPDRLADALGERDPLPIDGAPVLRCLASVKPEPVRWLWPGRIALGKVTLIAGDPGLGKSFLTLDLAARVTRGAPWPDRPADPLADAPGGVVLLSAEDDPADTIRPRLDAAGADCSRVSVLSGVRAVVDGRESERGFSLADDLRALDSAIAQTPGCRLVVIDPISAYLGGTDSHKNADVRALLAPLGALAAARGVAVVVVTHLTKSAGPALYRATGSLAFVAAARAAFAVTKDADDPKRRLFLPTKSNLGPDSTGLAFRIAPVGVDGAPAVAWEDGPVTLSADDALAHDARGDDRTERDDAADWLRAFLADGPRLARDVLREASDAGFSKRTLDRAKPTAGVRTRKEAFSGGWVWELGDPAEDCQERHPAPEGCHTPDVGNLREKPEENPENRPKVATSAGLATLGDAAGSPCGVRTSTNWRTTWGWC